MRSKREDSWHKKVVERRQREGVAGQRYFAQRRRRLCKMDCVFLPPLVGGLDGRGFGKRQVLPLFLFKSMAGIVRKGENTGVCSDVRMDPFIAMLPKSEGDATSFGQCTLSVLLVAYRIGQLCFWCSLRTGSVTGFLPRCMVPVMVLAWWMVGFEPHLTCRNLWEGYRWFSCSCLCR